MAEWRLAAPAEAQLARILADSLRGWGVAGRDRYAALLIAAMQDVADEPDRIGSQRVEGEVRLIIRATASAASPIRRGRSGAHDTSWFTNARRMASLTSSACSTMASRLTSAFDEFLDGWL